MQYLCPVNYLPAAIQRWTLDLEVWIRLAQKILIVIGDSYPHPPSYPQNKDRIDWREEARLLAGIVSVL